MAAIRFGRLVSVLLIQRFFGFHLIDLWQQGGVCSLLKRLSLDIDEQSVQPDAREGSSFDNLSTGMPSIFCFCFQSILRACYLHQYFLV